MYFPVKHWSLEEPEITREIEKRISKRDVYKFREKEIIDKCPFLIEQYHLICPVKKLGEGKYELEVPDKKDSIIMGNKDKESLFMLENFEITRVNYPAYIIFALCNRGVVTFNHYKYGCKIVYSYTSKEIEMLRQGYINLSLSFFMFSLDERKSILELLKINRIIFAGILPFEILDLIVRQM